MNRSDIRMRQNLCRRLSAAHRRQKYEPGFELAASGEQLISTAVQHDVLCEMLRKHTV